MDNQVALVTGASRGIGPIIARRLADTGYKLVLTGRSKPQIEALAAELGGVAIVADLTNSEDVERLAAEAQAAFGRIDVLVNNAGGDPMLEFDSMSWAQNQAIFELNALAPIHLAQKLLSGMLARGRGHVVNISAIAGRVSFPHMEAYAAAKDGIIGFTRVLRNDYRGRGVSASVLILGAIRDAGQGDRTAKELGLNLPRIATSPASSVADAVLQAIRKDKAEIVVMPGPGRLLKAAMDLFPGLGPAMNSAAGADKTIERVVALRKEQPLVR
jgi:short-subunit dehydrogenase